MKVFISQSKQRSLAMAKALETFIARVVPGTKPWVSDDGIAKGSPFMEVIRENLTEAVAGVVCLTAENLTEPWILFEAGALSTKVTDRVWTVLLGVEYTAVPDPLKGVNHTRATDKADVLKLVKSIYKTAHAAGHTPSTERDIGAYFEMFWPDLERTITDLVAQVPAPRTNPDPQEETLGLLRAIAQRVVGEGWRQEKTLAMLHVIYSATVGGAAPPLETLRTVVQDVQAKAALESMKRFGDMTPQTATMQLAHHRSHQPRGVTIVEPIMPPEAPAAAATEAPATSTTEGSATTDR